MPVSSLSDKRINHYFSLAKNASKFSDFDRQHLGAVIIYKGRVLSVGYNTTKQHPIQQRYNKERGYDVETSKNSLHAEISALIKCKGMDLDWSKVSLYIYREHKNGIRGMARSCPACMKAIMDIGIKNLYYTTENGWCYEKIE